MKFPKFDGTNPRLWSDQCETYSELYLLMPALKTSFARLNFMGPVAVWLQMMERKQRFHDWETMKLVVISRCDQDQYQIHLRQLQALKLVDSVTAYHSRFEELSHSIFLYNPSYDESFFVMQFLGCLNEEIHSVRPKTV